MDIPSARPTTAVTNRWAKKDDKQSVVNRFKNSRALFEKLEKENAGPVPAYKTGTAFSKRKDIESRAGVRKGLGDPTSYSAGSAQVKKTSNWIKSLDNKPDGENKELDYQSKSVSAVSGQRGVGISGYNAERNVGLSDNEDKPASNGHVPSSPKIPARQDNGLAAVDQPNDDTMSNGFTEPKSEPVASRNNMFNRQLSSDVLPKPYHAPTAGIRSVRRPDTSRHRYGSGGSTDKGDNSEAMDRPPAVPARKYPMEKSLSKDDIAASLAAAEKYLDKIKSGDESASTAAKEDEEPPPWRSNLQQLKDKRSESPLMEPEPMYSDPEPHMSVELSPPTADPTVSATITGQADSPDDSNAYDNVADVLSELKASGHVTPNTQPTQPNNHSSNKKPWERDSIIETCVDSPSTPTNASFNFVTANGDHSGTDTDTTPTASTDLTRQSAEDLGMDYDPVPDSTSSVYLDSKIPSSNMSADHHYNNIGAFLESKKRKESLPSDDEPYEIVAPPTPPSRRAPANLPLAHELDEPEVMSMEEANRLLSTR